MSYSHNAPRILMIALDAAEPSLIEKWTRNGMLPNLKNLLIQGNYTRLSSTADWLSGSPWPTFLTGTPPVEHGLYHTKQWKADQLQLLKPSSKWLPINPFWLHLQSSGLRTIAIDIPMKYPPTQFNGSEIYCWATHDQMGSPSSTPNELIKWVLDKYGKPPIGDELWGPQRVKDLFQLSKQLVRATSASANLASTLLRKENWNLFIIGLGATHRGGHKLWDLTGTWGRISPENRTNFSKALQKVYFACDDAVGQLVKTAGKNTTVIVFSLHGMGPNNSRICLLQTMLQRVLKREHRQKESMVEIGLRQIKRIKDVVPLAARYELSRRLPLSLKKNLESEISANWAITRAFCLPADLQGLIRINLKGRERLGIIKQGKEYDKLCARIERGLKTYADVNTGKPIVEKVIRTSQHFTEGPHLKDLPDIIVRWVSTPAATQQTIISPEYGSIAWPAKGRNPDGRSGNHRANGFLLIAGKSLKLNTEIETPHILDLAPTVFAMFNIPKPSEMHGNNLLIAQ